MCLNQVEGSLEHLQELLFHGIAWERVKNTFGICAVSMLMFTVLTGELASWRVSEVPPTFGSWKEGSGEDSGTGKEER